MARRSETEMARWTREEAIAHAKQEWAKKNNTDLSTEDFANRTIAEIDEDGWDEDIHGDIDLAMEAWARDMWEGTPWE